MLPVLLMCGAFGGTGMELISRLQSGYVRGYDDTNELDYSQANAVEVDRFQEALSYENPGVGLYRFDMKTNDRHGGYHQYKQTESPFLSAGALYSGGTNKQFPNPLKSFANTVPRMRLGLRKFVQQGTQVIIEQLAQSETLFKGSALKTFS